MKVSKVDNKMQIDLETIDQLAVVWNEIAHGGNWPDYIAYLRSDLATPEQKKDLVRVQMLYKVSQKVDLLDLVQSELFQQVQQKLFALKEQDDNNELKFREVDCESN